MTFMDGALYDQKRPDVYILGPIVGTSRSARVIARPVEIPEAILHAREESDSQIEASQRV